MLEVEQDDGRIKGANRQKLRAINIDDPTWKLVLNLKGEEEAISEFFRRLIKELDKEQQGKKKK